ncbi:hypothetical protein EV193_106192 [Herbihabitans rhizosphaerae]|uniref:Small secreted domain DUF320 n=1 Tax=Herbihabitans rhizosphaerae TaxID=1872711 RepID=A0A4Q7KL45_9PSEU|nr:hypothetical protein [Herbihabitans rhizosphaerae]RZS36957.1 hypothetical protein EV193_106192 [Herbihabitans rhizosphaerae]
MSLVSRASAVLPVAGTVIAAGALAGVAVFTVNEVGCSDSGTYVQHDGHVELVGGCVDPADLPAAPPNAQHPARPAGLPDGGPERYHAP